MASSLLQIIKQASKEERMADGTADVLLGTVSSIEPLNIRISSKVTLDSGFLYITETISDKITDKKIKKGDKVVLVKSDDGQKYLLIDKVVM